MYRNADSWAGRTNGGMATKDRGTEMWTESLLLKAE